MATYFISDLHLHVDCPQNTELLIDFLQTKAQHADALYILGDLFYLWLGDDVGLESFESVTKSIKQLVDDNIPVYFIHGNRDFLIGKRFAKASGCTILPDPTVIEIYNKKILITHGDLLCTLDQSYQKYRKLVQSPIVKTWFLMLPKILRAKIGAWVKGKTKRDVKTSVECDVNPQTVKEWLAKYSVPIMIHGHTHMPAVYQDRIVLGDWTERSAKILQYSADKFELLDLQN